MKRDIFGRYIFFIKERELPNTTSFIAMQHVNFLNHQLIIKENSVNKVYRTHDLQTILPELEGKHRQNDKTQLITKVLVMVSLRRLNQMRRTEGKGSVIIWILLV